MSFEKRNVHGGSMFGIEGEMESVCFGERAGEAVFGCLDSQRLGTP